MTVNRVEAALSISNQGARNIIRDAERRGWLTLQPMRSAKGTQVWLADDILKILQAPPLYQRSEPTCG